VGDSSRECTPIDSVLRKIDGRGYKAYRELRDACSRVNGLLVRVTRVQGDPFAPPSVVRVEAPASLLPRWVLEYPVPLGDWLHRRLRLYLSRLSRKLGEGHSGLLAVPRPGPVIIRRSTVEVRGARIVFRVWAGLPSRGRRILGDAAGEMLLESIPKAIRETIADAERLGESLASHVYVWRLQEALRSQLRPWGLVAFVGDGSVLPRRCGGCEEPLPDAVPFESPPSLRVELEGPRGEPVRGMGIRKGVTVIAGSAFHGKSTLLEALAAGVWNHVPGDGRERVVTVRETMYVRAEDGRFITCVDVSPMIHDLPGGSDTRCFTTSDASGATSTAASIQEAVEAGAELLLLDEDTAATNILYSDERASRLLRWRTVTPLASLARSMASHEVSLVIVSSGSLPLLAAADTVIVMEGYKARDATREARELTRKYGLEIPQTPYKPPASRVIRGIPRLVKPKLRAGRLEDKSLPADVDLRLNPHLEEESQLNAILAVITRRLGEARGRRLTEWLGSIEKLLEDGFDRLLGGEPGPGLGEVRALDVAFALNRLPGLRASH
jgi:predicted ABC-class ATPase